ncbi:VWA domain-containing protein [Anatilimnocola sp. NA78]|uniref:VWA domain-containing protein n=1 Tax=Anatilimnocola sp. NA78 TaxID=3415683 RepID=UPI003CE56BBF
MSSVSDSSLQIEAPLAATVPPIVRPPKFQPKAAAMVQPPAAVAPPPLPSEAEATATAPLVPIRYAPGWLVSMAVHLLLLVVLALFTVTTHPKLVATILDSSFAEEQPELLQVEVLKLEPLENLQPLDTSAASAELEVSNVMELGGEAGAVSVSAGDLQVDSVSDIGGLFAGEGAGMSEAGTSLKAAEFFGVKAAGRKFVFIVDSSNSMRRGKFDAAKEELEYSLRRLSPEQMFYVIFFDNDAERMQFPDEMFPEETAAPATMTNIKKCVTWIKTVKNELQTNPFEAVKFALTLEPDAIYILSDGKFTDRGKTVRYLQDENTLSDPAIGTRPRSVIHTIAFWQRDGEEAMKSIAKNHGGTYRFVPEP